jgi:hypothetical protein
MNKPNIFDESKYYRNKERTLSNDEQADIFEKSLFLTPEEIDASADAFVRKYNKLVDDFENKTKLKKLDLSIMVFAAGLQVLRWSMISNKSLLGDNVKRLSAKEADKIVDGAKNSAKKAANKAVETGTFSFNDVDYHLIPQDLPDLVARLFEHKVPYDVTRVSPRFKAIYPGFMPGLSGFNHRYKTLGHDPVAGFIFGTANIATWTLSVNNAMELFPSYHIKDGMIDGKTDIYHVLKWTSDMISEKPEVVGGAMITQAVHMGTDVFTEAGLPVPLINVVSPETSKFLMGHRIDTLSVARSAALAITINKIVEMFHKLFYDQQHDDAKLYEVKTRKVLMYSNVMSSLLNVGWVAGTGDMNHLDIGGIAVTLWRVLTDTKRIRQIKAEFIERELDNDFRKEEDEIRQQLAVYGFQY